MTTDLELAYKAIAGKRNSVLKACAYVDGPQPLRYSTQKLKEAFDNIQTHFEINWMAVVVDAANDRLGLTGFDCKEVKAAQWMNQQFEQTGLVLEAQKVHRAALGYSQGFLILWKDEDGQIEVYYNEPHMCEIFYDPEHPKKKRFAAKWFTTADPKVQEITLYYADKIEHYQAKADSSGAIGSWKRFVPQGEADPNPYGVIPVFELYCDGEIAKVTSLQDAVNKLFADMMVSAEFGAFVQRWVVSQSDPGDLKNGPNQVWWIPAAEDGGGQSSVGQFAATDLKNFLDAMDRIATAIFIITRTPKHYLLQTGANISGEALIAMEAPFVKKIKRYQQRFGSEWKNVASFLCQLGGFTVPASDILPVWEKPESTQPLTEAQTNQAMVNTGIPVVTVLRRAGWSKAEIDQMMQDLKDQKVSQNSVAQAVLEALRNQTAQDNPPKTEPQPQPDVANDSQTK
jgi:hypothetical protein